jgi:hypothetical protein
VLKDRCDELLNDAIKLMRSAKQHKWADALAHNFARSDTALYNRYFAAVRRRKGRTSPVSFENATLAASMQ